LGARSVAHVPGRHAHRLSPAAGGLQVAPGDYTIDKCCDWLQQLCLMTIPTRAAKIILFHFRRGSMLK